MQSPRASGNQRYQEVINPPFSWLLFILFMYFSLAFAVWAAFDTAEAMATFLILLATMPVIWRALRLVIRIDDQLRVGRAHIELGFIREIKEVAADEYLSLRRANYDARSFHATRPWVKRGVQVFIADERDPTTYWLIGCSRNSRLFAELKERVSD